jgi:hypothetical protein
LIQKNKEKVEEHLSKVEKAHQEMEVHNEASRVAAECALAAKMAKVSFIVNYFTAGLWIRIDLIRIRHFCSIRIQAKTELSKTISYSNFFGIKI